MLVYLCRRRIHQLWTVRGAVLISQWLSVTIRQMAFVGVVSLCTSLTQPLTEAESFSSVSPEKGASGGQRDALCLWAGLCSQQISKRGVGGWASIPSVLHCDISSVLFSNPLSSSHKVEDCWSDRNPPTGPLSKHVLCIILNRDPLSSFLNQFGWVIVPCS